MKAIAWTVFVSFIAISATANFMHGQDRLGGAMMAVIPVGFAATIFLVESMISKGHRSRWAFLAAGVVGTGAGIASYVGLYTMAMDHGVPQAVAALLPLAYDGVVAVASLAIRAGGTEQTRAPEQSTEQSTPSTEQSVLVVEHRAPEQPAVVLGGARGEPGELQVSEAEQLPSTTEQSPSTQAEQPTVPVAEHPRTEQSTEPEHPSSPSSKAEQIVLDFGPDPEAWPSDRAIAEHLGCSPSTAHTAKKKAQALMAPAEQ